MRRLNPLALIAFASLLAPLACNKRGAGPDASAPAPTAPPARLMSVTLNEQATLDDPPRAMRAARNETTSTVIQLSNVPRGAGTLGLTLRLRPLTIPGADPAAQIPVDRLKAYQVLSMPVDANRAGYVRQTGLKAASRTMPRALLPVPIEADGQINLANLRDPSVPLNPNSRLGLSDEPALLWLDVAIPATATPGQYKADVDLLRNGQRVDAVPLALTVYDFVLPDERHLHMVGRIEWDSLEQLYPDLFPNVQPQLISRNVPRYAPAVQLLDQFAALAHEHRAGVVVPSLQPVVKWPAGQPPIVDWADFDTVTEPWLGGAAFADKVPIGYWPLPRIDYLDRYPAPLQMHYWRAAASHFDQKGWIERAWVEIEKETPGRSTPAESIQLSLQAAEILRAHPQLRVTLPLEESQLQLADKNDPLLIDTQATDRILTAANGLVFAPPGKPWPQGVTKPARWLRTDLPGLMPYAGAGGDERDVRVWAWLAFLRQSPSIPGQVIGWDGALPHPQGPQKLVGPEIPADPNELTWFYPGHWFGVDEPVPTVQLKWLRRAQQDYEYLFLAKQRAAGLSSYVLSRVMTRQVQTRLNEVPDPTHGLLSGTTDPRAWDRALELVAKSILVHEPGKEPDQEKERELNTAMQNWVAPLDKPLQIARAAAWGWAARPGNWVDLRLGLDIYNGSDQRLTGELQWVTAPRGWEINPQPVPINPINAVGVYQVKPMEMEAWVDLDKVGPETRKPIELKFVDAVRRRASPLSVVMPVAASDRREGNLAIDGNLADWDEAADALQSGPMVVMLDRVSLQKQEMQRAATDSLVMTNWAKGQFYVAFKLDGVSPAGAAGVEKNDVDYQLRRAWGSDLCEILVQPVYAKNGGDVGQIVHLACKPRGQLAVAARHSPKNQKLFGPEWNAVVGAPVRYATAVDGSVWRGELAIPWELINDKQHQGMRPTLMRFNFVQYKQATGESASWAGPIDYGRDDSFMGLLHLRDPKTPGMTPRE